MTFFKLFGGMRTRNSALEQLADNLWICEGQCKGSEFHSSCCNQSPECCFPVGLAPIGCMHNMTVYRYNGDQVMVFSAISAQVRAECGGLVRWFIPCNLFHRRATALGLGPDFGSLKSS